MSKRGKLRFSGAFLTVILLAGACSHDIDQTAGPIVTDNMEYRGEIHPEIWPKLDAQPLDPQIEARVDAILLKMTLEQKVGQIIQGDSDSLTPEDVRDYFLGAVLSGGNSAPGELKYADTEAWLELADEFYEASMSVENVEVAIPVIWGIDAVHGHTNLFGAVVFPHNVGLGAARDADLMERIATVTAREIAISGHDWTFAPTLAVPQNDRWGRGYEGFSENPDIVASYADAIVKGLQGVPHQDGFMGDGRVISSAKHFLGDGGTTDGVDQGDTSVSEEELRDVHGAGYPPAIEAGVQTIMASFNSFHGQKMHGHKALLTDVLKDQMGFNGFIVGDWNGHGQIEGCTNIDCPEALLAGLDMYMAPDSWKGLYDSTLKHVQSGRIPMERLDDAVRRILRVKLASGLFEKPKPSKRALAGELSTLGSEQHRAVAREAVRKSLVLLKNNDQVLPLDPEMTVYVVGDGADSIAKISGGWTLSWQGGVHTNDEFPNGQTILSAIRDIVGPAGGEVIFDPLGERDVDADVVVAIYGEDPYAEFQGDLAHLKFKPNGFDPTRLSAFKENGAKVVSVFLSGRPMWVNPEINASDAFIAAWLPGSEGGGVADMLFADPDQLDFVGRLPFSWPNFATDVDLNFGDENYEPLYPFGYGLSLSDSVHQGLLSEDPGDITEDDSGQVIFAAGRAATPWIVSNFNKESISVRGVDHLAQEDALRFRFNGAGGEIGIISGNQVDLSAASEGGHSLAFLHARLIVLLNSRSQWIAAMRAVSILR